MENRILKQMGRVYIFNRNREHESSTVSVLLICQRTLIGALALLFYIARYKNLDYHQLVCLCVCWCACVSLSVSVCVSATIMMYFIWNGWAHAFASGASTAVNAMACKIWMRTMVSFSRTHTHTRFLRKIHADSLINLLFASHSQWMQRMSEKKKRTKIQCIEFSSRFFSMCVWVCVCCRCRFSSSSFHCTLKWNYRMIQQILQQRNQKTICQSQALARGKLHFEAAIRYAILCWHKDIDIY